MTAVFLDRDGVLNEVVMRDGLPGSPRTLAELRFRPGAAAAIADLRRAGHLTLVVTNQPDLARELLSRRDHEAITARVRAELQPDDVAVCPHDDRDDCACRKPRPGLLHELADRWGVDLEDSYMIGDTWKDMDAGRAAGCRTILLRAPYNESVDADHVAADITAAARLILARVPA